MTIEVRDRTKEIQSKLRGIVEQQNVRILFAIESGSRAWDFASVNSDWDVRFLYVNPIDWYLSVNKKRDVIDAEDIPIEDDLDMGGWELRKALSLMQDGNPVFYEWLNSPIVYQTHIARSAQLLELAKVFFNKRKCWYHYYSMAERNYRQYLQTDTVRLKKYLYVLRPLLAAQWLNLQPEASKEFVPMKFTDLVEADRQNLSDEVYAEIQRLLEEKKSCEELTVGSKRPILNRFIEHRLEYPGVPPIGWKHTMPHSWAEVDAFFSDTVQNIWREIRVLT